MMISATKKTLLSIYVLLTTLACLTSSLPIIENNKTNYIFMKQLCNVEYPVEFDVEPTGENSSFTINATQSKEPLGRNVCISQTAFNTDATTRFIVHIDVLHIPALSDGKCVHYLELAGATLFTGEQNNTIHQLCGDIVNTTYISARNILTLIWNMNGGQTAYFVQQQQPAQQQSDEFDKIFIEGLDKAYFKIVLTAFKTPTAENECEQSPQTYFLCESNKCIDARWKCDGLNNCGDPSDEPESCQYDDDNDDQTNINDDKKTTKTGYTVTEYIGICGIVGIAVLSILIIAGVSCNRRRRQTRELTVSGNPKYNANVSTTNDEHESVPMNQPRLTGAREQTETTEEV